MNPRAAKYWGLIVRYFSSGINFLLYRAGVYTKWNTVLSEHSI